MSFEVSRHDGRPLVVTLLTTFQAVGEELAYRSTVLPQPSWVRPAGWTWPSALGFRSGVHRVPVARLEAARAAVLP